MYTALLQNQVLGINNPYLLHEMHNKDENLMKEQMYSQMQKQMMPEDIEMLQAKAKKSALLNGATHENEQSPYNSKYTVLKFSNVYSLSQ